MDKRGWIGVDLSKESFDASVCREGQDFGPHLRVRSFRNDPEGYDAFAAWRHAQEAVEGVCVESTGRFGVQFALALEARGAGPVSILEPARPKAHARSLGVKDKTDPVDARVLAHFGLLLRPRPQALPERAQRELKECSRQLQTFEQEHAATRQRLQDGPESAAVVRELEAHLASLAERRKALEAEMARLVATLPHAKEDGRRLQTIKGVGPKTARRVLAELGDLRRYTRGELVALAGLYPVVHQSGTSVHRRPRLAKGGGGRVRHVLYMAAMVARRHNPQLKAFADRLEANGKAKMAVLGAVMRKLLVLMRAVVVSGKDYDPVYQP